MDIGVQKPFKGCSYDAMDDFVQTAFETHLAAGGTHLNFELDLGKKKFGPKITESLVIGFRHLKDPVAGRAIQNAAWSIFDKCWEDDFQKEARELKVAGKLWAPDKTSRRVEAARIAAALG